MDDFMVIIIGIGFSLLINVWADSVYKDQVIAAIEDNGCNTHIDIPAKPEYREYNRGNL